jgi:hypothetical protein
MESNHEAPLRGMGEETDNTLWVLYRERFGEGNG